MFNINLFYYFGGMSFTQVTSTPVPFSLRRRGAGDEVYCFPISQSFKHLTENAFDLAPG